MVLCSNDTVRQLVHSTPIVAQSFIEEDGSVTLSMSDLDLVVNAENMQEAKEANVVMTIMDGEIVYQI